MLSRQRDGADELERSMRFVVNSLAARTQSVAEIAAKLARRGVQPDIAATLIGRACALGYLDDAALAAHLARGFRDRGYGRRRAAAALQGRGVAEADASSALEAAFGDADESQLAAAALGSRPVVDERQRRRAASFLVRRGFSTTVAWQVVRARADPSVP